jgi:2-hydroxy-4-carboxymuconate semialdehyde hemiacetal dehydrogenase
MSMSLRVCIAEAGAFGIKHIEAISAIDGMEVVSLVGPETNKTAAIAARFGIPHTSTDFTQTLAR